MNAIAFVLFVYRSILGDSPLEKGEHKGDLHFLNDFLFKKPTQGIRQSGQTAHAVLVSV